MFRRLTLIFLAASFVMGFSSNIDAAPNPHQSFFELPTSNGFGVGHFSVKGRKLKTFYPHIYKRYDEGEPEVPNWMFDAYWGIRGGTPTWFQSVKVESARYIPGTNIVEVVQKVPAGGTTLTATQYVFFPFSADMPLEVMLLHLENESGSDASGFAAFTLQNFHIGGGNQNIANETYERIPKKGYVERGRGGLRMYYRSITEPDGFEVGTGNNSPYQVMLNNNDFTDQSTGVQPAGRDLAHGFQFNVPSGLKAGDDLWLGVAMGGTEDGKVGPLQQRVDSWVSNRKPEKILADAKSEWNQWQATGESEIPSGLSADEEAVWRQGLAVMRMAQVREPNGPSGSGHKPNGQLLAALPKAHPQPNEGIWNIAWVRDGSYAIAGLARAGYAEEARKGLEFMLEAEAGGYQQYVGHPYAISITRYYGRGKEETDSNQNGPNIEFDGFGLFLYALGEQLDGPNVSKPDWWKPYWPTIRDEIADTLVFLFEEDTWLISPDSSIWERHWNGNQKHFTYTSVLAARGLCVAARLAEKMGETGRAKTYRSTVSKLRKGIRHNLVDGNDVLAGNLEELEQGQGYMDLAAVEAFNFDLIDPSGPISKATLDEFRQSFYLGDPNGFGGYYRNDDGDWYDSQEWVFVDLRVATALGYAGRTSARDKLLEWIVSQTRKNYDLMGELYCAGSTNCPTRGDYRGSVPMVGFGPGAFILAATEREAGDNPPGTCAPIAKGTPGEPADDVGVSDTGTPDTGPADTATYDTQTADTTTAPKRDTAPADTLEAVDTASAEPGPSEEGCSCDSSGSEGLPGRGAALACVVLLAFWKLRRRRNRS